MKKQKTMSLARAKFISRVHVTLDREDKEELLATVKELHRLRRLVKTLNKDFTETERKLWETQEELKSWKAANSTEVTINRIKYRVI